MYFLDSDHKFKMSHTDLCRGGHNVQKYLDEVERYLNIEKVGYPDLIQSSLVLKGHTFSFDVTAGDKLTFYILPWPGSPICIFINDKRYVVSCLDIDWGTACNANFVSGKLLNPPAFRCTGLKLVNEGEGTSNLVLKGCKKDSNYRFLVELGDYNKVIFGTAYKISCLVPKTVYEHSTAFGQDLYNGVDYPHGNNGVFNFIFEPDDFISMVGRPTTSSVVNFDPLGSCIPNFSSYLTNFHLNKHFAVHYECNSTEQLTFTYYCRYEFLNGNRELRSSMENSILKHFIDRHKEDPHNFTRKLNFTI